MSLEPIANELLRKGKTMKTIECEYGIGDVVTIKAAGLEGTVESVCIDRGCTQYAVVYYVDGKRRRAQRVDASEIQKTEA